MSKYRLVYVRAIPQHVDGSVKVKLENDVIESDDLFRLVDIATYWLQKKYGYKWKSARIEMNR